MEMDGISLILPIYLGFHNGSQPAAWSGRLKLAVVHNVLPDHLGRRITGSESSSGKKMDLSEQWSMVQWVDKKGKLWTGNQPDFPTKYGMFLYFFP